MFVIIYIIDHVFLESGVVCILVEEGKGDAYEEKKVVGRFRPNQQTTNSEKIGILMRKMNKSTEILDY